MSQRIRIGTRGSQLALAQARWTQAWLQTRHPASSVELVIIKTTGDRFVDRPLSTLGGKGVFVKEIEEALSARQIDCAVHSMKDVPVDLAPGLVIAAIPQREDPRDVLLARACADVQALPPGARVGTSSLRRMALLRELRADLDVRALRGNVDTRLRKLDAGELDAIVLAAAGLRRLDIARNDLTHLDRDSFLPAIGQGALAIETRADDCALFDGLQHEETAVAVRAERAFLSRVGGSCRTPLAAHGVVTSGKIQLQALIARPDGTLVVRGERVAPIAAAAEIGSSLAAELLERGGEAILRSLGEENESR